MIVGGIKSIGRAAEKLAPLKVGALSRRRPHRHRHVRRSRAAGACRWSCARRGRRDRRWASACSSRCATASPAASTRTKPVTARPRSRTAPRGRRIHREQGLQAVMEVFIVSFVTATISAMTILVSGVAERSIARQTGRRGVRHEHGRRGRRVQRRDSHRRRLDRRVLRVPVRLHDAHRLGVLRRAVPRVHPRPRVSRCRIAGSTAC